MLSDIEHSVTMQHRFGGRLSSTQSIIFEVEPV
jgi:hypothetical protein